MRTAALYDICTLNVKCRDVWRAYLSVSEDGLLEALVLVLVDRHEVGDFHRTAREEGWRGERER